MLIVSNSMTPADVVVVAVAGVDAFSHEVIVKSSPWSQRRLARSGRDAGGYQVPFFLCFSLSSFRFFFFLSDRVSNIRCSLLN